MGKSLYITGTKDSILADSRNTFRRTENSVRVSVSVSEFSPTSPFLIILAAHILEVDLPGS
jgi:hypothetical protein